MTHSPSEAYLETQVLTATPQKLRLMLIDGAMRFARQALECWHDEDRTTQRIDALARCNDVVTELYSSIRADESPVATKVQELYRFLLLQLTKVVQQNDEAILQEVVDILAVERETWRQLCEQMPDPPAGHGSQANSEVTAAGMPAINPQTSGPSVEAGPAGGLSLEA